MSGNVLIHGAEVSGAEVLLRGTVVFGSIQPGMEAGIGGQVIVIEELFAGDGRDEQLKIAGIGRDITMLILGIKYDFLANIRKKIIHFSDTKSAPVAENIAMAPDAT